MDCERRQRHDCKHRAAARIRARSAVNGNFTAGAGGTYRTLVGLAGPAALNVSGTVTLSGALDVIAEPGLATGTSFTILKKTSARQLAASLPGNRRAK